MDLVQTFFDEAGGFRNPYPSLPHYDSVSNPTREVDAALCLAAMSGRLEVVRYLLERGAEVNAPSPVNTTPLDEAINNGHEEVAALLQSVSGKRFVELDKTCS